jgi:hypothetical protein
MLYLHLFEATCASLVCCCHIVCKHLILGGLHQLHKIVFAALSLTMYVYIYIYVLSPMIACISVYLSLSLSIYIYIYIYVHVCVHKGTKHPKMLQIASCHIICIYNMHCLHEAHGSPCMFALLPCKGESYKID